MWELLQRGTEGTLLITEAAELLRELRRQLTPTAVRRTDFDDLMVWWLRGQWEQALQRAHVRCKNCRLTGGGLSLHQCERCHRNKAEAQCAHRAALGVVIGRGRRRSQAVRGFTDPALNADDRDAYVALVALRLLSPLTATARNLLEVPNDQRIIIVPGRLVAYECPLLWRREVVVLDGSYDEGDTVPPLLKSGRGIVVWDVLGDHFNYSPKEIEAIFYRVYPEDDPPLRRLRHRGTPEG